MQCINTIGSLLLCTINSVLCLNVLTSDHLRAIVEKCREQQCLHVLPPDFDDRIQDSIREISNNNKVLVNASPMIENQERLRRHLAESSVVFWLTIEPLETAMNSEELRELTTRNEHYVLGTEVNLTQFDAIPLRMDHKLFLMTGEKVFEIYRYEFFCCTLSHPQRINQFL